MSANTAVSRGGGLGVPNGTVQVVNSVIADNYALDGGGYHSYAEAHTDFINVTIAGNVAVNTGGGVYNQGELNISNTIIATNIAVSDSDFYNSDLVIGGSNNFIGGDPLFVKNHTAGINGQWGDSDDVHGNYRLTSASTALIDAGDNTAAGEIGHDLDGNQRKIAITQDSVDVGAYEYQGKIVVTTLDDDDSNDLDNTNDPYNQYISLREALKYAKDFNWTGDDTIKFHESLKGGTIILNGTHLVVDSEVTIEGLGAEFLTIDAGGLSRVITISDNGSDMSVSISGMTITRGLMGGFGGGIYVTQNSEAFLSNLTIKENTASTAGGGIYSKGIVNINSSNIFGNTVTQTNSAGGGIFGWTGSATNIKNTVIAGNTAECGGGVYGYNTAEISLINTTIAGNYANNTGGGIYYNDSIGSLFGTNTIVACNDKGGIGTGDDIYGALPAGSYNHIGTRDGDPGFIQYPDIANDNYGNLRLAPGSAAINAGDNTAAAGIAYDLDGNARIIYENVDIGAYEYEYVITVDTYYDEDDENYTAGDLSLREALDLAYNHTGPETIRFDPSLHGHSIVLDEGQLEVNSDVWIDGPGSDLLNVDGDGNSRVFNVASGVTAKFSGMTITGGNVSGTYGGGIFIQTGSTAIVSNSAILGNKASNGGGIYGSADSTVAISNSIFAGNIAIGYGGGIYGDIINLVNVSIAGNYAGNSGGGIYETDTLNADNSIISLNVISSGWNNIHGSVFMGDNNLIDVLDPGFVENPDDGGDGGWINNPYTPIDEGINNYGNLRLRPDCEAAINAGNNTVANGISFDLDRQPRIADDDLDIVDIGAYEYQGKIVVTTLDDNPENDPNDLYISLSEALDIAYEREGTNLIGFDASLGSSIEINGTQIDIDSDVIFKSPAAGLSIANDIAIAENVLLSFYTPDNDNSVVVSGDISGLGKLEKLGNSGTLSIFGTNTYSGGTTIKGGVLLADATGALPGYDTSDDVVVHDGGTIAVNAGGTGEWQEDEIEDLLDNAHFYSGSALGIDTSNALASFSYTNPISIQEIGLTKFGEHALILTGNNTYDGVTTVVEGSLMIDDYGTLGDGDVVIGENTFLVFTPSAATTVPNNISGGGELHHSGPGKLILTGENTYTGDTEIYDNLTLQLGNGTTNDGSVVGDISIGQYGTLIFANVSAQTYGGAITGEGCLEISGWGTLTLTGNSEIGGGYVSIGQHAGLVLGNGGNTGSLGIEDDENGVIDNDGVSGLAFEKSDTVTLRAQITGTGYLSQRGTGTLILNSNTLCEQDSIAVSANCTFQVLSSVKLSNRILNYGTLDIAGIVEVGGYQNNPNYDIRNWGTINITGNIISRGETNIGTICVVGDGVLTAGETSIEGSTSSVSGAGMLVAWQGLEGPDYLTWKYQVSTNGVDYTTLIDEDETPRSSFMLTGLIPDTEYNLRIVASYKYEISQPDYSIKIYDGGTIKTDEVYDPTGLHRIVSITSDDGQHDPLVSAGPSASTVESTFLSSEICEDIGLFESSIVRFQDVTPADPYHSDGTFYLDNSWVYAGSLLEAVTQSFRGLVNDGSVPTIDESGEFKLWRHSYDNNYDFYSFDENPTYPEGGLSYPVKKSYTCSTGSYKYGDNIICERGTGGPNGEEPDCGMPSESTGGAIVTMPAIDSTGGATACGGSCDSFAGLTYNSLDRDLDTGFGPGWSDVDELPSLIMGQNVVLARFGTETNIWFDKLADGTYQARYNSQHTLVHDAQYPYLNLTLLDGTVYKFHDDVQMY